MNWDSKTVGILKEPQVLAVKNMNLYLETCPPTESGCQRVHNVMPLGWFFVQFPINE